MKRSKITLNSKELNKPLNWAVTTLSFIVAWLFILAMALWALFILFLPVIVLGLIVLLVINI